jgi:hypothetical protein
MERRNFIHLSTTASLALGLPVFGCVPSGQRKSESLSEYQNLVDELLTEWCKGMLAVQIDNPDDPTVHGALGCPACNKIHGRCMDAVYPFMHMAHKTGDQKYLKAAIDVMKWSENVSMPDGSWTVIPDPKSWKGITVFGAIALGEALHHHGEILPAQIKRQWTTRLKRAAEFIHQNFTIDYSHVNYAFTAVYALNFLGRMFDNQEYLAHSRQLAAEVPNWLTEPNQLIFGEDKPADKRSAKGLLPVDLGYNVEETLNGLVQYAVLEKDDQMLQLLTESMESHLQFMLPDGAWDNSWGTRQNKWTYWGSRTTDGCQPAFSLMADRNSAFGAAAFLNTELLKRCTVDGLLAGGPHYDSHGVKPCVHHTFAHAKSLAFVLDTSENLTAITKDSPVPRQVAKDIRHFPEIDVWLAARGSWRATVSAYDNRFKTEYSQQAAGGSLAVLWHLEAGPVFLASMAEYILAEKNNQQPQPGEDFTLTPRIERQHDGLTCSNLHDLTAEVHATETDTGHFFEVLTTLTNRKKEKLSGNAVYRLSYSIRENEVRVMVQRTDEGEFDVADRLVLPLISPSGEPIIQNDPKKIEIIKPGGSLVLTSNVPLGIKDTEKSRIFNMVPGVEALPVRARPQKGVREIVCTVSFQ